MSEVWHLSVVDQVKHTGKEWLCHILEPLFVIERSRLLMTLWRCSFIRNEMVHLKKPPPLEVSKKILVSYLESLVAIKVNSNFDPLKGKTVISYDHLLHKRPNQNVEPLTSLGPPTGWLGQTKL